MGVAKAIPKRLTDRTMRMIARRERDSQWEFMERVAREGIVIPWPKKVA